MPNIEITKREILVSFVIILLMIGLGFFISTSIHNSVSVQNDKYFRALKVDNDFELFNHAINTEVGDMLSYGRLSANEAVTDSLIEGEYFSLIKVEEHYVMKTRTVTYTDSDGNTRTEIEIYWEWDEVKRERFNTDTFTYLGRVFNNSLIKMNHHSYIDTVKTSSSVRFKFYVIPKEFDAALYSRAKSKTIKDNIIYPNQTIEELILKKEKEADSSVVLFWILWFILILVVVAVFVALENRFINK